MKKTISLLGGKNTATPTNDADLFIPSSAEGRALSDLPVDRLEPDPDQPRKEWTPEELDQLESRIRPVNRIIQPIVVRENPNKKGYYLIKAGEGRWRVGKDRMGWQVLPCIIEERQLNNDDRKVFAEQILENLGRIEMTPIHTAQAIQRWMFEFEPTLSSKEAAEAFGLSTTAVSRLLKLIDAPESLQQLAKVVTNLNTLSSLKDLSTLDPLAYEDAIARINTNSYPNAENELRKHVSKLKRQNKGEPCETDPTVSTQGLEAEPGKKSRKPKGKPQEDDNKPKEPVLFTDNWQASLANKEQDALSVSDLNAISTVNGDGLLEIALENGQTILIKLNYQNQLKMSTLLNRCMEI